jgi:hypothetical protein
MNHQTELNQHGRTVKAIYRNFPPSSLSASSEVKAAAQLPNEQANI